VTNGRYPIEPIYTSTNGMDVNMLFTLALPGLWLVLPFRKRQSKPR